MSQRRDMKEHGIFDELGFISTLYFDLFYLYLSILPRIRSVNKHLLGITLCHILPFLYSPPQFLFTSHVQLQYFSAVDHSLLSFSEHMLMYTYLRGTLLGAIKLHKEVTLLSRSLYSYGGDKTGIKINIIYGIM